MVDEETRAEDSSSGTEKKQSRVVVLWRGLTLVVHLGLTIWVIKTVVDYLICCVKSLFDFLGS